MWVENFAEEDKAVTGVNVLGDTKADLDVAVAASVARQNGGPNEGAPKRVGFVPEGPYLIPVSANAAL